MKLQMGTLPAGVTREHLSLPSNYHGLEDWPDAQADPLVKLVPGCVHGCLAEGYTVLLEATPAGEGMTLHLMLRQKLQDNFLTSPYLRRYFAEDAAIAAYVFFDEAFASGLDISGGSFD
jgi:hypothetical protein